MKNKFLGLLLLSSLTLSGCSATMIAGMGVDAVSYATTGKTVTSHILDDLFQNESEICSNESSCGPCRPQKSLKDVLTEDYNIKPPKW